MQVTVACRAFIVESDAEGFSLGKKETNMGQRCSDTTLDDLRRRPSPSGKPHRRFGIRRLDERHESLRHVEAKHRSTRNRIGDGRPTNTPCSYSGERMSFGKPLHRHQAIQFMLADMKTKIEASRMLTWKSAAESDAGLRNTESAAHAKRFAADTAMEVSTDAVQVFGGYGYSEEYPVAQLMRAAKVMQIYEGSSQVQRMIIGREITKDL